MRGCRVLINDADDNDQTDDCCVFTRCTGKVDAYIKLLLYPSQVVECEEGGRNIFLYPDQDLHIQPYMQAEIGITENAAASRQVVY